MSGVIGREPSNMAEHRHLALEDQLRDLFHRSLLEQSVVGHEVGPPIPEDPPKAACPEGVKSTFQVVGQRPGLAAIKQDREHQPLEHLDFCPAGQVLRVPHPLSQLRHGPQAKPTRRLTSLSDFPSGVIWQPK